MKIALLTDTHFGARGDSVLFYEYMMEFYKNVFFPTIKERKIDTLIHLGDVVDRRKFINFNILNRMKKDFIRELENHNLDTYFIVGNHDTYYKNTNKINAMENILSGTDANWNPRVISEPETVKIGNTDVFLLPWINSENYDDSMKAIKKTKSKVCFSHLELAGFEMMRGLRNEGGMSSEIFKKFDMVCTGHFHCKSMQGNITYLGTAYELFWSDYKDTKGFHIWDTETNELEYIVNPHRMFYKVWYKDDMKLDLDSMKGKYVKLIVEDKPNPYKFDVFVDKLYKSDIADISIIEDDVDVDYEEVDSEDVAEDTMGLLSKYIDNYEIDIDKTKLKSIMNDLYIAALRGD
ncbi:recombinase [archaeon]|nr:recombinase [archaeon]